MGVLTFNKTNPTGYGRIKRIKNNIEEIVEEKDCDDLDRKITEINTGIMCIDTKNLISWLSLISNNNSQKEYYLTDIVALARKEKIKVRSHEAKVEITISGVNTKTELAMMERALQKTKTNLLMEQGVTLLDPSRTDIRGDLKVQSGCRN